MTHYMKQRTRAIHGLRVLSVIALMCIGFSTSSPSQLRSIPVILDTDIGGDIDDAWALSFLLACPELDVKLVVSDSHDTCEKARIISEFLKSAGRVDIPIGVGVKGAVGIGSQETWISSYSGKVHRDGVQALIDTIMNSPEPVTLLAIGPVPNLELALEREPRIVEKARLIVMGGCIGKQEQGDRGFPEYNVRKNAKAAQKAYSAAWDVTMTPIDTVGKIRLEGEYYAQVRDARNPMARMLMEQYHDWNRKQTEHRQDIARTSSILWDTLAVCLAFNDKFCRLRDIRLSVTDEGVTKPTPDGKLTHVAIEWKDLDSFHKLLAGRIANYRR
jgi:inosine-uridine nucleoside N-ribohydrolase